METNELLTKSIERIRFFEGYRDKPYLCSAGRLTIGYGYNYQDNGLPAGLPTALCTELLEKGFTKNLGEYLLDRETRKTIGTAEQFKWFAALSLNRKTVIVDMLYQLGAGRFLGFKKMLSALNEKSVNWSKVAAEMKDSKWYEQSKRRSRSNVDQMKADKWTMYEK